jgi:predicted phosphoadenosine phosphosulfate sulfurtransferase
LQYIIILKCDCRLCSSCPTCFPQRLFTVYTQTFQIFLQICQYFRQLVNLHVTTCLYRHRGEVELLLKPMDNLGARRMVSATPTPFLPSGRTRHPSYRRMAVTIVKATCKNCSRGFGCDSTNDFLSKFKEISVFKTRKH